MTHVWFNAAQFGNWMVVYGVQLRGGGGVCVCACMFHVMNSNRQ